MAGKPKKIGTAGEARFLALANEGATEERIVSELAHLGIPVSRAWVGNRLRLHRGLVLHRVPVATPPRPAVGPAPAIPTAEDLDRALSDGTVDELLEDVQRLRRDAAEKGNVAVLKALGQLELQAHDRKRKDRPPPVVDPNQAPDMIAAKERGRAEFHRLIDQAVES
jgi:hypothetical protein